MLNNGPTAEKEPKFRLVCYAATYSWATGSPELNDWGWGGSSCLEGLPTARPVPVHEGYTSKLPRFGFGSKNANLALRLQLARLLVA